MGAAAPFQYRLSVSDLESLFSALHQQNYINIGPVARDGAIMLEELDSFTNLAKGYYEDQGRGSYYLDHLADQSLFGYSVGPQSLKKYLHPSRRLLWSARKKENGFDLQLPQAPEKMAFWGVRNCDLEAIRILDRVFLQGHVVNEWYQQLRKEMFVIAAGCSHPSGNCFCTSMNGSPMPVGDFDLALVEVIGGERQFFLTEVASKRGHDLCVELGFAKAGEADVHAAREVINHAEEQMPPRFTVDETRDLLRNNLEHKHWEEVAARCLSCANCTMVCPTCFCTTTEDVIDLTGDHTERWLRQDSCFTAEYSYIHGGVVRSSTKSRYRQWITHKFMNWHDQFGTAGCVGCGRCVAWCPMGIDITQELAAIKDSKLKKHEAHEINI